MLRYPYFCSSRAGTVILVDWPYWHQKECLAQQRVAGKRQEIKNMRSVSSTRRPRFNNTSDGTVPEDRNQKVTAVRVAILLVEFLIQLAFFCSLLNVSLC